MRKVFVTALALAAVAMAGCHTAKPADQRFHNTVVDTVDAPSVVMANLTADATNNGFGVSQSGPFDLVVDFGEQVMRVPVPTDYGIWGSRVSFRNTRVRGSAAYSVSAAPGGGSRIRMSNNPIYYHPDIGNWLPGPYDVPPGGGVLDDLGEQVETDEIVLVDSDSSIVLVK